MRLPKCYYYLTNKINDCITKDTDISELLKRSFKIKDRVYFLFNGSLYCRYFDIDLKEEVEKEVGYYLIRDREVYVYLY